MEDLSWKDELIAGSIAGLGFAVVSILGAVIQNLKK